MPLSADDFAPKKTPAAAPAAPAPAPAPAAAPAPEAPEDTSYGRQGLFGAGPFASPRAVTETVTAGLPRPIASVVRAFQSEIGEPALRLLPTSVTGVAGAGADAGLPSPLQEAADVAQLAGNLTPAGRVAEGAIMGTQATIDMLTGKPNTARTLVSIVAGMEAGTQLVKTIRGAVRESRGLLEAGSELTNAPVTRFGGLPQRLPKEQLARGVQLRARLGLGRVKFRAGRMLDAAEEPLTGMQIAPGTAGYIATQRAMTQFTNDARLSGPAEAVMHRVDDALRTGNPVSGGDLVELRRLSRDRAKFGVNSLNPDRPVGPQRVNEFRDDLANALELAAPRPQAMAFRRARNNYRISYAEPARALEGLTNANTSPADAFNRLFNPANRELFNDTMRIVARNPGLNGKLRAGFVESLADAGGNLAENAAARFKDMRPAMAVSGLFTPHELDVLGRYISSKQIPNIKDALGVLLPAGTRRGQVLPAVIGIGGVSMFGPVKMLAMIAGSGALLELRRLQLLAGGPEARTVARVIASRVDDYAKALHDESDFYEHAAADVD